MNTAARWLVLFFLALPACRSNALDGERIAPKMRVGPRRPSPGEVERGQRLRRNVRAINNRLDRATSETRRQCLDELVALGPPAADAVREILGPTHPMEADRVLEALGSNAASGGGADTSADANAKTAAGTPSMGGADQPDAGEENDIEKAREIERALVNLETANLDPVARYFERRYWTAQKRMLAGDVDGALQLVKACIELAPTPETARRFRALRLRLKREAERRLFFDVVLESSEGAFPFDYDASLRMVVLNRGLQPLTVTFSGLEGADPAFGTLQLDFTMRDAFGSTGAEGVRLRLDLAGEHVVPGGQVLELALPFTLPEDIRRRALVVDVRARVHVRPQRLLVGTRPMPAAFTPEAAGFRLVAPPFEKARDNALAAMANAARSGDTRLLFVSAAAVAPGDRAQAAQTLVGLLDGKHSALERASMASLRLLSGQIIEFTPTAWRQWWSRNRAAWRHADRQATGRLNENPVFPWQE